MLTKLQSFEKQATIGQVLATYFESTPQGLESVITHSDITDYWSDSNHISIPHLLKLIRSCMDDKADFRITKVAYGYYDGVIQAVLNINGIVLDMEFWIDLD